MATPKTVTDGSSDLDEAVLNLFVRGGKAQVKINYCIIDFDTGTNTPTVSGTDSDGEIVTGDLAWDAGNNEIDVTLSGFTATPCAIATMLENAATNVTTVVVRMVSSTALALRFVNGAGGVGVDPNAAASIALLVVGS